MLEGGDEDKSYGSGFKARKTANCNFDGTTTNRASMRSRLLNFGHLNPLGHLNQTVYTENYGWLAFL